MGHGVSCMLGTATLWLHRLWETQCPCGTCSLGTALIYLLRTGFVLSLSLPGVCCLLRLKQNMEVTTVTSHRGPSGGQGAGDTVPMPGALGKG